MEKKKYKKLSAARESNPAFDLNQIGGIALGRAKAEERYKRFEIITALLMCALSLEAALNYLGQRLFDNGEAIERCLSKNRANKFRERGVEYQNWEDIERSLSPKEKLQMIAKFSGLENNLGGWPFQSFSDIFGFRDNLVHAKPSHHFVQDVQPDAIDEHGTLIIDDIAELSTDWEKLCTVETAEKWRKAIYGMSSTLSQASKCQDPIKIDGAVDTWGELEV
jgi:hypothetical protein